MANSGTVCATDLVVYSQYNNLRTDVLNVTTGHGHTGATEDGKKLSGSCMGSVNAGTVIAGTISVGTISAGTIICDSVDGYDLSSVIPAVSLDATPVRSLGSAYQNGSKGRYVLASVYITASPDVNYYGASDAQLSSDGTAFDTILRVGLSVIAGTVGDAFYCTLPFFVPPGSYYKVIIQGSTSCSVTKSSWAEYDFH